MKSTNWGQRPERNEKMLIQSIGIWIARLRMNLNLIGYKVLRCYRNVTNISILCVAHEDVWGLGFCLLVFQPFRTT